MSEYIKKNINKIIAIFLILQPILDILTGICINTLKLNITIGVIIKILFLLFICIIALFVFKKKKLLIPYFIIGTYFIFYIVGMVLYKDSAIIIEIKNLIRTFYFPIMLISLYSIKDHIKISNMTLTTVLFLYLIFLFIPTLFGLGYKSYQITKVGTLGFFNSANELSGIISILTPIMFIVFINLKKPIPIITLSFVYLVVILMMGTKTPLLSLIITLGICLLLLWGYLFKKKKYKQIVISMLFVLISCVGLVIIIPKTNFYKNIKTHLDYLKLDNVFEVFQDKELIDHFIFSSRLKFMQNKAKIYHKKSTYEKLFGIGYINNNKETKLIEMDYFDIYYSHGLVGFIIFYGIVLTILYKVLNKYKVKGFNNKMILLALFLIVFLSFFTGHIMTSPSVSFISVIIILSLAKREKKDLLFTAVNLDLGGIEKALVNLVNRIDYNKYNVTIVLEKKQGIFLDRITNKVNIEELKVSNNSNIILRKAINLLRKQKFSLFNYKNYDFSCCYATYSYSGSKLALMASNNTAFYIHSDYSTVYKNENEFRHFFDSRNIDKYKNIILVSNETKEGFIKYYNNLKERCHVYNNFIDEEEIINLSKEELELTKKDNKKLFVYVGRLDESSKKITKQINLVKEIKDINLWIIGDGPDRKKYEKLTRDNKLEDRITFFGQQKNPYKYMREADYIILTSDYEGFPVTYLEAITLNKKIITTFPTSDDEIDIRTIAKVINKDEKEMVKEVKEIIKSKEKVTKIKLEKVQKQRMNNLEEMFNEVV